MTDMFSNFTQAFPTRDQRAFTLTQVLVHWVHQVSCTRTRDGVLSALWFGNCVASMALSSHKLLHITLLAMGSVNGSTVLCIIFCVHCLQRGRGIGPFVSLNYCFVTIWHPTSPRVSPLITWCLVKTRSCMLTSYWVGWKTKQGVWQGYGTSS